MAEDTVGLVVFEDSLDYSFVELLASQVEFFEVPGPCVESVYFADS